MGSLLLALSIVGLGDLLSPAERLACRMADPGCTTTKQLSNVGGTMDNTVSSIGVLVLVAAGFFLAAAMRRSPGWQGWAVPTRCVSVLIVVFAVGDVLTQNSGLGGLYERLVALTAAAGLFAVALGALRRGPHGLRR